jgi:hypothetical protein
MRVRPICRGVLYTAKFQEIFICQSLLYSFTFVVRSCKPSHIFLLIRLFVMYEFPEKSMYFLFNKRMIKYNKIIFFQKICIKNGMRPIRRCVLYAEKYGNSLLFAPSCLIHETVVCI